VDCWSFVGAAEDEGFFRNRGMVGCRKKGAYTRLKPFSQIRRLCTRASAIRILEF
jgi:hypothetical protein